MHPLFDRYSNTLLVSLNNRISIRDTYGARGGAVDCQVATLPGSARSVATGTTDVMLLETEKHQKLPMKLPLAEADADERVVSESRGLSFYRFLSKFPRRRRHSVILITRV